MRMLVEGEKKVWNAICFFFQATARRQQQQFIAHFYSENE